MDLEIRRATSDDVPLLVSLIKELAEFEKLLDQAVVTTDILRDSLFGSKSVAQALIGESEEKPVAFALYFFNFSTFLGKKGLYLEDLYVKPEFRSQGFGMKFLKHLAAVAVNEGCARFDWQVLDWNERAIKFYQSLGAKPMSDWITYRVTGSALKELAK